ncbi:MAG: hypothetical protein AAFQ43_06170 [Bacteroidota bacterium]
MTRLLLLFAVGAATGCASPARLVQACPAETLGAAAVGAAVGYAETPGAPGPERTAWIVATALSFAGSASAPCRAGLRRQDAVERHLASSLRARTPDALGALQRDADAATRRALVHRQRCWPGRLSSAPDPIACDAHGRRLQRDADELRTASRLAATHSVAQTDLVWHGLADAYAVRVTLPAAILFEDGVGPLRLEARPLLDAVAAAARGAEVEVRAHVPASGDPDADRALSARYAHDVGDALSDAPSRPYPVRTEAIGSDHPMGAPETPEGRAASRRVEVLVLVPR